MNFSPIANAGGSDDKFIRFNFIRKTVRPVATSACANKVKQIVFEDGAGGGT
jgi:hypothetical protein